jgi:hypothetical protein
MKPESGFSKILRFIGILFLSLTAAFTVLGGAGTTCAALFPTHWESMAPLAPFQWLYILYVVVTIGIGVLQIRALVMLFKGKPGSYKATLIALVAGVVVGTIHIATSRNLRGSSMPVDGVVFMTLLTLVIFLIFRFPAIWSGVDYTKAPKKEGRKSGGGAALVSGILSLTIQWWIAPTHTWNGVNYADAFHTTLTIAGGGLILFGIVLLSLPNLNLRSVNDKVEVLS